MHLSHPFAFVTEIPSATPFDLQTNDIKFSHSSSGSMSSAHAPPPVTTPAAHVQEPEFQKCP